MSDMSLSDPSVPADLTRTPGSGRWARQVRIEVGSRSGAMSFWAAVALVLASPLLADGHNPMPQLIWTAAVGLVACLHYSRDEVRPDIRKSERRLIVLAALVPAFALASAVSALLDLGVVDSLAPRDTLIGCVRLTGYLLLWLVLRRCLTPGRCDSALVAAIFVALLFSQAALVGASFPGLEANAPTNHSGLTGPFPNRNAFATYLGMAMMATIALARGNMAPSAQVLLWVVLAILTTALVATQSRMGLLSALLGAGLLFLLPRQAHLMRTLWKILAVAVIAAAIAGPPLAERLADLPRDAVTRLALYEQVIFGLIAERPWTGFGLDTFTAAFEPVHAPPVSTDFSWDRAHSIYLTLWAEMGVVFGSILPISAILYLALVLKVPAARSAPTKLAAVGALVLSGIHSAAEFSLEIQGIPQLLILLAAIGLGATNDKEGRVIP